MNENSFESIVLLLVGYGAVIAVLVILVSWFFYAFGIWLGFKVGGIPKSFLACFTLSLLTVIISVGIDFTIHFSFPEFKYEFLYTLIVWVLVLCMLAMVLMKTSLLRTLYASLLSQLFAGLLMFVFVFSLAYVGSQFAQDDSDVQAHIAE